METMNIALSPTLKEYVQERVQQGGYSSASEYVRELIRSDQRAAAKMALETELLRGLASGPAEKMTGREWSDIRREVKRLATGRKKS